MKIKYKVLSLSIVLCMAAPVHANPGAAARAAEIFRAQQAAAQAARAQSAARAANLARKAGQVQFAQQEAARQLRAAAEQQAVRQAAVRHDDFLRISAEQVRVNKLNLGVQSHVKQQVDIAARKQVTQPVARVTTFNSHAAPGLVYRADTKPTLTYVGKVKNPPRYPARQAEHIRNPKSERTVDTNWTIVGGAPGGNAELLSVAERAAYDAHLHYGSKLNMNLTLTNMKLPMAEAKYLAATKL